MNTAELVPRVLAAVIIICVTFVVSKKFFIIVFSSQVRRYAEKANRFIYRRDVINMIGDISSLKKIFWKQQSAYQVSFCCPRKSLPEILERIASSIDLGKIVTEALWSYTLRDYSNFEQECQIERFDQQVVVMHIQISDGAFVGRRNVTLSFYERPLDPQHQS